MEIVGEEEIGYGPYQLVIPYPQYEEGVPYTRIEMAADESNGPDSSSQDVAIVSSNTESHFLGSYTDIEVSLTSEQ